MDKMKNATMYKKISILMLIIYMVVMLIGACLLNVGPVGESSSYMVMTQAYINHKTMDIRQEDIESSLRDYKGNGEYIKASYEGGSFPSGSNSGKQYTWYMPTYSLAVVPAQLFLRAFHLDQENAFPITNVISYAV